MSESIDVKEVPGYEGHYTVSRCGRVYSLDRHVPRKDGAIGFYAARELKPFITPKGYLAVTLCKNSRIKVLKVHRIVLLAFVGDPGGLQVNHIDCNRQNNRLENLEWVTSKQNTEHRLKFGKRLLGIKHPFKLREPRKPRQIVTNNVT